MGLFRFPFEVVIRSWLVTIVYHTMTNSIQTAQKSIRSRATQETEQLLTWRQQQYGVLKLPILYRTVPLGRYFSEQEHFSAINSRR